MDWTIRMTLGELNPCGGGDPIPLMKPALVIGRQPSCDISLRFANVSSRHCEIRLVNGYWHVRDLGSRNGIKVNGIRCDSHWLMPGDVVSVAKHRYEVQYTPNGEAPPPQEPDPMSMGLLEKAGLSRDRSRELRSTRRRSSSSDLSHPRRAENDDDLLRSDRFDDNVADDELLDDGNVIWLDK